MILRYSPLHRRNIRLNARFSRDYSTQNYPNKAILELLQRHKTEEENKVTPNGFKIHAFHNAIQLISKVEKPIRSGSDIAELPGIGLGIRVRIDEYLCSEENAEENTPRYHELMKSIALKTLQSVPGIGLSKAKKLVDAGCLTLKDLRLDKYSSMLSPKQLVHLKFMDSLVQPVEPRQAEDIMEFCRDSLDTRYECLLVSDYRRQSRALTDVQLMVLHPDIVHVPLPPNPPQRPLELQDALSKPPKLFQTPRSLSNPVSNNIFWTLKQRGLIAETLLHDTRAWSGIVRWPGKFGNWGERLDRLSAIQNLEGQYMRMTIHLVPQKSRGTALLALTGDTEFHKDMIEAARKNDMLLNGHGLWKWITESTASLEQGFWSLIDVPSEEAVFEALGINFVPPEKRNFRNLSLKHRRKPSIGQ